MPIVNCKWCSKGFNARQADLNRGWGTFCSKSCKAKKQESKTGQYKNYINNPKQQTHESRAMKYFLDMEIMHEIAMDDSEAGWDGHKDY